MSAMIAMIKRNRRVAIFALILIAMPVAIVGWWLGSPLFIDKTVDEEFPFASRARGSSRGYEHDRGGSDDVGTCKIR